ncbi:MAG: hypothetical protein JRN15_04235 [Nitrososphaerota archaeon]|nr:hypothetical protein [Nitrososphaerota archaeon]
MPEIEEIAKRKQFYNRPDVAKFLSKHGVPKNKKAMNELLSTGNSKTDQELVDCLSHVVFAVHPQQINIRDLANGEIIVSINR